MSRPDESRSAGEGPGAAEAWHGRDAEMVREALRTPTAAAFAGIAFAILLTVVVVLIRTAIPVDPSAPGTWVADDSQRRAVVAALWLVPFAGIAFLWFIGVVRDRIGAAEDRFFATAFLGSGLLFIAMLFASAASAAALVASAETDSAQLVASGAWEVGRNMTHSLLSVYAMRMAAVFVISTSTILMRTGRGPRRLSIGGYAIAIVMLVTAGAVPWVELLLPAWLLILSVHILLADRRRSSLVPLG